MKKQQVKQRIIDLMKESDSFDETDINYHVWELYEVEWCDRMDCMNKDELVNYCEIMTMKLVDELCEELL